MARPASPTEAPLDPPNPAPPDPAPAAASARVRAEWLRRVEAEYRSAAVTHHLVLWLLQLGVSPDLVRQGLRIVNDEIDHAELAHEIFVAAGGAGGPTLARETLCNADPAGEALELAAARVCVESFCLGETVAVRLFKALRERCDVPVARRVLDRVLEDEVRHRAFGWLLLESLLEAPYGPAVRALVVNELPRMLASKARAYASPAAWAGDAHLGDTELRWGLMPARRYAEILEKTIATDYRRRFARVGIDCAAAWTEAQRRLGIQH